MLHLMRLPSSRLTTGLLLRKAGNARSSALASFSSATDKSVRIDNLFDRMDSNNDGLLDRDEFHKALGNYEVSEIESFRKAVSRKAGEAATELRTLKRAVSRNELSQTTDSEAEIPSSSLASRTLATTEVMFSKIFFAGFGWQGFSILADSAGFADTSASFALMTGAGDFCGVFLGHSIWMLGKSAVVDDSIDTTGEIHTGILLGSAAFCSGTAWQPCVNMCTSTLNLGFDGSAAFTWLVCGTFFYSGLRLGRTVYGNILRGVEKPTYSNLKADAALSISVGAATGAFVGTDTSFGAANWLEGIVGIGDAVGNLHGMFLAGTSTVIGFAAIQMIQNIVVPAGKNWCD